MRMGTHWAASITAAIAVAGMAVSATSAATPRAHTRAATAKPKVAHPAATHAPTTTHAPAAAHGPAAHGHVLKFRPARGAAAADAGRLGALVGKQCTGRADMQRNEHQWVVLCSNGKTFVVEPAAAHQAATPPVECSLSGTGPEPACFP